MLVAATGKKFNGRQQIAEYYTNYFKQARALKSVDIGPDEAHAMGDGAIWAVGHGNIEGSTATYKVHYAAIYIPQGTELKLTMLSIGVNATPPQSPTVGSSTPPK